MFVEKKLLFLARVSRVSDSVKGRVKGLGLRLVLGLGLVVAAAYRPLVLRMSLISYTLDADSGR